MTTDGVTTPTRRRAVTTIAGVGALGALLMAVAHTGAEVPVLSSLGPQGGSVPPAVVAFGVGTALFAAIAVGVWQGQSWGRWLGLAVAALSVLSGIAQFRGPVSAIGMAVAIAMGVLLLKPITR